MATILVIEDDDDLRFAVHRALCSAGHDAVEAESVRAADAALEAGVFDAIVTDVNLGESGDGIDLIGRLRSEGFEGGIVVMTGFGSVELAVRAMKHGADDFIEKPIKLDELIKLIAGLLRDRGERRRLRLYDRLDEHRLKDTGIVGDSDAWTSTLDLARRVAAIPIVNRSEDLGATVGGALPTILLTGETGCGKGVLARFIHDTGGSDDAKGPFIHINCSALPPQLIESELFGHERGAFTDARETREGLFEMAEGGTVLLDEIGDLPVEFQAKLLTVIERGLIRRVGGKAERAVRARIIAATNHDLDAAVANGLFRRDLLYRLNAFTVEIPPLRDRGGDAVLIARSMLDRFCIEYGREKLRLTPSAERTILAHDWPGNVRELINAVQRAAMLCDGPTVGTDDLALGGRSTAGSNGAVDASVVVIPNGNGHAAPSFDFDAGMHRATDVERTLMIQALTRTRGNVSKAARLIGMQRSSFRYRVERYDLESKVQELAGR